MRFSAPVSVPATRAAWFARKAARFQLYGVQSVLLSCCDPQT